MKKSERPKALKHEDGIDLISNMPDAILVLILSGLPSIEEVIRTSILSIRWRYLWTSVPSLDIQFPSHIDEKDELGKNGFQEFVYWVLANKSVDLDSFILCCNEHYGMSTIWRWIHMAVSRNVKQLDLTFSTNKGFEEDIKMPHCLGTCRSLEVLKLCLFEHGLNFPNFMGYPALRVLELSYFHLLDNDDLVRDFLKSCPLLEDLSLIGCFMCDLDVLCISCPKLKKLRIENEEDVRMCNGIKISCPKLVFLELKGPTADDFFFESLDSLKEAVIDPEGLPPALEAESISMLIPGMPQVEFLQINLYFFSQCVNAALDPALPNLKTLVLTTTISAFTMDELNRILSYYPKLESLKLIIKERFLKWKEQKLDEAEARSSLNPDLKRVEFLEFNGEKPKLALDPCSRDGCRFMEMVFSWGNKAKISHLRL